MTKRGVDDWLSSEWPTVIPGLLLFQMCRGVSGELEGAGFHRFDKVG
jgi:hypothetical protein